MSEFAQVFESVVGALIVKEVQDDKGNVTTKGFYPEIKFHFSSGSEKLSTQRLKVLSVNGNHCVAQSQIAGSALQHINIDNLSSWENTVDEGKG